MSKWFTYTDKTNLFQLDVAARILLAEVTELAESISWKRFCSLKGIEILKEANYATSYKGLHQNAVAYLDMVRSYIDNHNYYEDNSLQDRFLNGEIIAVRKLAIKALEILQAKVDSSKDDAEKIELQNTIDEIRLSINMYLSILRDILQHDVKLQTMLLRRRINYIEKYDLSDI